MALVRNDADHRLSLTVGYLDVGEQRNIDVAPAWEQALISAGSLTVVDPAQIPAAPASPFANSARPLFLATAEPDLSRGAVWMRPDGSGGVDVLEETAAGAALVAELGAGGAAVAAAVAFTPTGTIAAGTVQAAIAEVATDAIARENLVESGRGARTWVAATVYPQFTILTDGTSMWRVLVTGYTSGASIAVDVTAGKLALLAGGGTLYLPGGAITTLENVGHSYLTDPFVNRVATALGATFTNRAVGGQAIAGQHQSYWGGVPSGGAFELRQLSTETLKHVLMVMFGINDLAQYDRKMPMFGAALETLISNRRIAPGGVKLFSDADIAYSAGWTSGSVQKYTMTAGATFTWTSPAGYLGGWESWHFSTQQGQGALLACEVNAAAAGSLDMSLVNPTPAAPVYANFTTDAVHRVYVPPGAGQTVKFTASAVAGATYVVYFDSHGTERDQPPLAIVLKQPKPVDYSIYASGYYHVPTHADVDALNVQIDASCEKFDGWVVPVDLDRLFRRAPLLFSASDKLHPRQPQGSNVIANAVMSAIRSASQVGTQAALLA